MGVSHSPDQLAAKLKLLGREFGQLDKTTVRAAAQLAKEIEQAGAPRKLRGVGKHGALLGVRYTLSLSGDEPKALVFATGPWQLIEDDTKAHQIPRQRRSRTFEGVFGHAVVPGGAEGGVHGKRGVRTRVHHPGTHGKHPWAKALPKAEVAISRLFQTAGVAAIARVF